MLETWVQSPGWEDALEEDVATHPRILAWNESSWTEEPHGVAKSQTCLRHTHTHTPPLWLVGQKDKYKWLQALVPS